jgi:hypothetical protein
MRFQIAIVVFLFAAVGHVSAEAPLDDLTPCSAAVRSFASKDEANTHAIVGYMDSIFQRLDREHKKYGEPGILNERLTTTLEIAALGFCNQHQRSTIANEAAEAYRSLRALIARMPEL